VAQVNSVGLEGMQKAQGAYQTAVTNGNRQLTDMQSQVATLQQSWTGEASQTFQAAVQQWLEDFANVQSYLQQILTALEANTNIYTKTHAGTVDAAHLAKSGITGASLPGF
jgi:WXG100 family type VII secretion target